MEDSIAVSVVVASHGRHLRLRWLLNALDEQTLDRRQWDLIVVHTYDEDTARRVIEAHPLSAAGVLRHIAIEPGTGQPVEAAQHRLPRGARRPARVHRRRLPPRARLARTHAGRGARSAGGGRAGADAARCRSNGEVLRAPHVRTLVIDPINPYKQAANILYPRELFERLGGFDERAIAGEDVGLWMRAQEAGARVVAAPDAVVSHAVESHTLPGIVRQNLKWRYLAYLAKRHPEFRAEMPLRIFWDDDHLRTTAALVGVLGARRKPALALLALPYVRHSMGRRASGRAAPLIAAAELPGQFVRQVAEVVGMAAGGVRNRTPIL